MRKLSSGLAVLFVTLSVLTLITLALYYNDGPVVVLNSDNFSDEVFLTEQVVLVEFYAPWCQYCKRLVPAWTKAAENLKGLVKLAAIDCNEGRNQPLCSAYQIQGYPSIKVFPSKAVPDKNNPGKYIKKPKDYVGERAAKAIVEFALDQIPSYVKYVSEKYKTEKSWTVKEFLEKYNDTYPRALLFTDKEKTAPLFKALSVDFHYRMILGEVKNSESSVLEQFSVTQLPKLLVFPLGEREPVEFKGKLKRDAVQEFLNRYALKRKVKPGDTAPITGETGDGVKSETVPEPKIEPESKLEVIEVRSQSDLSEHCLARSGLCALAFWPLSDTDPQLASEHEVNINALTGAIERLRKELESGVALRFLRLNTHLRGGQKLAQDFDLADVPPGLVLLNPKRKAYVRYLGAFDVDGLAEFFSDAIKGQSRGVRGQLVSDIEFLTDDGGEVSNEASEQHGKTDAGKTETQAKDTRTEAPRHEEL